MHIDLFCEKILESKKARYKAWYVYCHKCKESDFSGNVSPYILSKLIRKAKYDILMQQLLVIVLWNADGNSISEINFRNIMKFNKHIREKMFFPMEHIEDLAFYQMLEIYRDSGSCELFDILINYMCKYDCFSIIDVENLINDNRVMSIDDKLYFLKINQSYFHDNPKYKAAVDKAKAIKSDAGKNGKA